MWPECRALRHLPRVPHCNTHTHTHSFVLVNCHDDDAGCDDEKFTPDGGYIPRILFATSQGEVKNEIQAPDGNAQYKYFYHDTAQIAKGMTAALAALKAEEL